MPEINATLTSDSGLPFSALEIRSIYMPRVNSVMSTASRKQQNRKNFIEQRALSMVRIAQPCKSELSDGLGLMFDKYLM
jgi:hypothetical protein